MSRLTLTLLIALLVLSACAHQGTDAETAQPEPAGEIQILPSGDIILKSKDAPDSESEVTIQAPSVGPDRSVRP